MLNMLPITAVAVFVATSGFAAATERPPNIVLIVADDIGRDWLSCYGADHGTPHVDELSKQGLRYRTAWSTPSGTPTRVTLLTGQYPFRHGWTQQHDVRRQGGVGLSWKRFTTFARVLRDHGYATAIAGQWQLNDLRQQADALKQHGFDEHCVWTVAAQGGQGTGQRFRTGQLLTNGRRAAERFGPDAVNRFAAQFVQRHTQKPFLLYYPMLLTGASRGSTAVSDKQPAGDERDAYAGYVTQMDQLLGRLVAAVDQAGLTGNTMIVFTSDNGSAVAGTLDGRPYNRGRGQTGDWGVHVPLIVRAPFLIPQPGLESADLVDFTDLYPTLLELARVKRSPETPFDGKSLVPSLSGDEDPFKKRNWIYTQSGSFRMVRDWQYSLDNRGGCYRLSDDPLQIKNLFTSQERVIPGRRARLKMILERFPADAPPPFDGFGAARGTRND